MSKQSKPFLLILLCAAIANSFGCTTTAHTIEPSVAALENHEIEDGDNVLPVNLGEVHRVVITKVPPNRRCKVARTLAASIAIFYNPGLSTVFVADHLKRRMASK
jgi:hypothetical protein